ncbi:MAG: hypothetical protein U0871_19410 [Gemmataceae bacterium]
MFEDQKDTIKLTSLVSNVVDRATQEKIDVVKSRLIRNYGYNESSATDVLNFVASIFAGARRRSKSRKEEVKVFPVLLPLYFLLCLGHPTGARTGGGPDSLNV